MKIKLIVDDKVALIITGSPMPKSEVLELIGEALDVADLPANDWEKAVSLPTDYYSESKREYIHIQDMASRHIANAINALERRGVTDSLVFKALKTELAERELQIEEEDASQQVTQYYSESKGDYVFIDEMSPTHLGNAIRKLENSPDYYAGSGPTLKALRKAYKYHQEQLEAKTT